MTPELWEQITDIYHEAAELSGADRDRYLNDACGSDPQIRKEVESLLEADRNAGEFISTPAVGSMESWSGQFVGHYQIMSRIGSGGMGEVYLAKDSRLNRLVALKTLPPVLANRPDHLRRFEKEAQAAAAINHPNVATIHSVEETGKQKFITMEYVEGKNLNEFIDERGLELRTFLDWFIPIADALSRAHEKGIVHRDIKPGNVMITTGNVPKILDFGLAQIADPRVSDNSGPITRTDQIIGTPAYMSPEQAEGKDVDARSDIFSLGVLMYEALSGERPFKGDSYAAVISELMTVDPVPLHKIKSGVPKDLSRLIGRCLKKRPEQRPATTEEVRVELEKVRTREYGDSSERLPTLDGMLPNRWSRMIAYGLVGISAVLLAGYGFWKLFERAPEPVLSISNITQRRLSQSNDVVFAHITPDGGSLLYNTMEPNNDRALWIRRLEERDALQLVPQSSVQFWGGLATTSDGAQVYYITAGLDDRHGTLYRISTLGGTPKKLVETVNDLGDLSPDDKRMLYIRYGPNVLLLSANASDGSDEQIIYSAEPTVILRDPRYSTDGSRIFFIQVVRGNGTEDWSVEEIALDGSHVRTIVPPRKERIGEIVPLSDGSSLLVNAVDQVTNLSQIYLVSLADLKETRVTNDLNSYFGLSVSRDDSKIVTCQRNFQKDIWVGEGSSPDSYRKITAESTGNLRVNWTPDGRLVFDAVDNNRPHIHIMNADGTGRQQLTPNDSSDFEPRVTPDGRYIVFTSERTGERKIWRMKIDGSEPTLLTQIDGTGGGPMISPDGENVYFFWSRTGERVLGVVSINGGPVVEKPLISETYYALSPDGKQVAYTFYSDQEKRFYVGLRPIESAAASTIFNISPTAFLYWPAGSNGLYYRELEPVQGSSSTVMFQPIAGGPPRRYLSVEPDFLFDFALGPDGKRAALMRGQLVTDAVMLSRIQRPEN
ncbi:MAG: protein kinase [Chloracidobacterium sp.]|nr:protein kinase [Chloracidobacterium sp.]